MANWKPDPARLVRALPRRSFAEEVAETRERRKREQDAWLLTPEGIAYTAQQAEAAKKRKELEQQKLEEQRRRKDWVEQYQLIANTRPGVGELMHNVSIYIDEAPDGREVYSTRLYLTDPEFPTLPEWVMRVHRRGLICFMDKQAREELKQHYAPNKPKLYSIVNVKTVRITSFAFNQKSAHFTVTEW